MRRVVDDEHAEVVQADRLASHFVGLRLATPQRNGEVERGALADLAVDPDTAAHQLDELCGDSESEARAAVPTGRRSIRLHERAEDLPLLR